MNRVPLSPKKIKSSNVAASPPAVEYCSSQTKRSRYAKDHLSPRKFVCSPSRPWSAPRSPTKSSGLKSPKRSPLPEILEQQQGAFKVLSDATVYALNLEAQINDDPHHLVLEPPIVPSISPSPKKRDVPRSRILTSRSAMKEIDCTVRETRQYSPDPLLTSRNAFLTPPRPRIGSLLKPDDRLIKSASPKLGRARESSSGSIQGFTIYLDSCEYFSQVNTVYEQGADVNKENDWSLKRSLVST